MKQITVVLALASPALRAKIRSEVLLDPGLALLYDAQTPAEAVTQTRMHQPQVVLCDRGMTADGQLNGIAQQVRVVSLLVLVTQGDAVAGVCIPVPVAGVISASARPGNLGERLQAIVQAPASFIEPGLRLDPHLAPPSEHLAIDPLPYDANRIPSLPRSGRLAWLSDQPQAEPEPHPMPTDVHELAKRSFMKSVFDSGPDKG